MVIFGKELPKKSKKWFQQFDKILSQKELSELTSSGSCQQACELADKVSRLTLADGRPLPKLINYKGYELWWINYNTIHHQFCLPYTQYKPLLHYLKDFDKIYLFEPPWPYLFRYFLEAHNRQCVVLGKFRLRNLLPFPFGVFIQLLLSVAFFPWLMISRPKLMVHIGDKFSPPHDYDSRQQFIYEELRRKKIPFVEFIRSLEPWPIVLQHAWKRKRPVFYPVAVIEILHFFSNFFRKDFLPSEALAREGEQRFWFLVAIHYLHNIKGSIFSIQAMKFFLQLIGVKAAHISAGCDRTFHEILGCKLAGIKTVGLQHALTPRWSFVADFTPGFDGEKLLSVDKFGLPSQWWKEYYISHSKAYKPEQLYVAGSMRPLKKEDIKTAVRAEGPLQVLFISEQLADPFEVMPHLSKLMVLKDIDLYLKFRPHRDGFEQWLIKHQPDILKKVKIFRGTVQEAVSRCDVVVGSHSTAVLEALMQLKPLVFFWTNRWGDYFELKSPATQGRFYADSPEELVRCIKNISDIKKTELKQLQERFFGDPYQNGSAWAVEQAIKFINHGKK